MNQNGNSTKLLTTTMRSFEIVNALRELEGARVSELANHLEMPKSTVHKHLSTLKYSGFVVKEGDVYHVGLRFLTLGGYARARKKGHRMARSLVKQLAEKTEERAQFIVEDCGKATYLYKETTSHAVKTDVQVGMRTHLHTISAGKAILAHLPRERVNSILDNHGLPQITDHTLNNLDDLFGELEVVRNRGYAFNIEERIEGQHAVGVPVFDTDDSVIGAFSVSGPAHRMKGDWFKQDIPDLLLGTANELELNIAYP